MTHNTQTCTIRDSQPRLAFGFLFEPFGWMMKWLGGAVESDPALLTDICSITRQRMHLIGLALAHLDCCVQQESARLLLRGRARDILDCVLGRRPRGLKRALSNLSLEVLSPEGYRRLVELLDDPASFKLLAHAPLIDDDDLERFASIPVALRSLVTSSASMPGGRLSDGLRFLVMRGVASSYDALVDELKSFQQLQQLSAHVRRLVDALPLPNDLPPPVIGPARRLDSPDEIRDLTRQWRNCLAEIYLPQVDAGQCVIYLWEAPQAPAACAVERHGRLGWFLAEVNGPRNVGVKPELFLRITQTFAEAGILQQAAALAIQGLAELDGNERPRRRGHA